MSPFEQYGLLAALAAGIVGLVVSLYLIARSLATDAAVVDSLIAAQRDLYRIMAELAFTDELRPAAYALAQERVDWLESASDALAERVELPPEFILPGETTPGAALDVARTTARRAERQVVALARGEGSSAVAVVGGSELAITHRP